jgi:hypothetical protein
MIGLIRILFVAAMDFHVRVYHFSPLCNLTPRFLDALAYGQGKSDTPPFRDNLLTNRAGHNRPLLASESSI